MLKKINEIFGTQDMTVGKPMSNLLKFSIPLLIGNFAQQLYSTVDSIIVGRYVGDTALSAIGTTLPVLRLLLVLFMAISTGTGVMVAQYFGAKDRQTLSRSIGNSMTLIFVSSLVIMAIGIPWADSLLRLTNTPVETFALARSYLVIMLWGTMFSGFYNIGGRCAAGARQLRLPFDGAATCILSQCSARYLVRCKAQHERGRCGACNHYLPGSVCGTMSGQASADERCCRHKPLKPEAGQETC